MVFLRFWLGTELQSCLLAHISWLFSLPISLPHALQRLPGTISQINALYPGGECIFPRQLLQYIPCYTLFSKGNTDTPPSRSRIYVPSFPVRKGLWLWRRRPNTTTETRSWKAMQLLPGLFERLALGRQPLSCEEANKQCSKALLGAPVNSTS